MLIFSLSCTRLGGVQFWIKISERYSKTPYPGFHRSSLSSLPFFKGCIARAEPKNVHLGRDVGCVGSSLTIILTSSLIAILRWSAPRLNWLGSKTQPLLSISSNPKWLILAYSGSELVKHFLARPSLTERQVQWNW